MLWKGLFYVKMRKIGLFKAVNILVAVFCFWTMMYNHCSVSVLSPNKAESYFDGSSYLYEIKDDFFSMSKDGKLVGRLKAGREFEFQKNAYLNLYM